MDIKRPWEHWIPGVLGKEQIKALVDQGSLLDVNLDSRDHSSFDLRLSDEVFELNDGAIKPSGGPYRHLIKPFSQRVKAEKEGKPSSFVLQPRRTYVVRLQERLVGLQDSSIFGQATAKSSVGRMDVLARLVVDGMSGYEEFVPWNLGKGTGEMFLEITSMTFPVRIQEGKSLSQLRLFYGPPSVAEIKGQELIRTVIRGRDDCFPVKGVAVDGALSVDLSDSPVANLRAAAFGAVDIETKDPINLWRSESPPEPWKFWKLLSADKHRRLSLKTNHFYILRSKERLALPAGVAAYCRAIDETIGEMRIHYAGFVHPFFGRDRQDGRFGTPLIFEVRGHDLPVSLADGEIMAKLVFYRMSEDAKSGGMASPYDDQELKLSAFFAEWPENLKKNPDNSVQPVTG